MKPHLRFGSGTTCPTRLYKLLRLFENQPIAEGWVYCEDSLASIFTKSKKKLKHRSFQVGQSKTKLTLKRLLGRDLG